MIKKKSKMEHNYFIWILEDRFQY